MSDGAVVVVVGAGSGPVNDNTNVSVADPLIVKPTATHSDALTHDTEYSCSKLVPVFGLGTIDHALPSHDNTNVESAEPLVE